VLRKEDASAAPEGAALALTGASDYCFGRVFVCRHSRLQLP